MIELYCTSDLEYLKHLLVSDLNAMTTRHTLRRYSLFNVNQWMRPTNAIHHMEFDQSIKLVQDFHKWAKLRDHLFQGFLKMVLHIPC